MRKIKTTILVEASKAKVFQEDLKKAIKEVQAAGYEAEVDHSMCQAQKGVGYMYSAIVTGRQA